MEVRWEKRNATQTKLRKKTQKGYGIVECFIQGSNVVRTKILERYLHSNKKDGLEGESKQFSTPRA